MLLSNSRRPLSPIAAEACSPAVFTCMSVHREPAPGGPGSGLRRGRKRFLCQLPLWFYILYIGLDLKNRWKIGPFAHMRASVVGVSVDPSVVGRDWSPVSSNKARGCCCRTPGDHGAPLQPRRAARRYLRARGTARADSRRSGVGLAPRPQALPMPAAALVLYIA